MKATHSYIRSQTTFPANAYQLTVHLRGSSSYFVISIQQQVHSAQFLCLVFFSGFPLSWLKKFPALFQDPRSIFPGPCRMPVMFKYRQTAVTNQTSRTTEQLAEAHGKQRQNTRMYYAVEMCGNEYSLNRTIGRDVRTRKFQHLHLRHFVRLPHHYHSLDNSRTFQELALKFPGLSRTKPIFQDFPGPGNCTQKNPGHSRSVGTLSSTNTNTTTSTTTTTTTATAMPPFLEAARSCNKHH